MGTERDPSAAKWPCERLRASRRPCATVDGARHLEAGSRAGIGRGAAGLSCIRFVPHPSIESMLCGVTRASVRAGGDMGPNRLRQTRAKAQYVTFSSRSRAGERAVTFPVHMVSLMTGPKVASLADMATLRLPVLYRGRGGGPDNRFRGLPVAEVGWKRYQCAGGRRAGPHGRTEVEKMGLKGDGGAL